MKNEKTRITADRWKYLIILVEILVQQSAKDTHGKADLRFAVLAGI